MQGPSDSWWNIHESGVFVMPKVISLAERKSKRHFGDVQIIEKIVDGKRIECVNLDALAPAEREKYLAATSSGLTTA
jgi:hypothetical protein